MNTKHTPGQWKQNQYGFIHSGKTLIACPPTEEESRAGLCSHPQSEEAQSNSRLIAAAPDLLAACEAALRRLEHYTADTETCDLGVPDERALALIREAILKAKGDSKPATP